VWKRLGIRVLPSVVLLGVAATAIQVSTVVHHVQAVQMAAQTREALKVAQVVTIERDQALALNAADARLDTALQRVQTVSSERDQLNGKVQDLQGQVDKLTNQLAAVNAGVGGGTRAIGSMPTAGIGNHFPWGWCTFYVASRRYVPWNGNAITWLWGARTFGFPTGSTPRVGAIMVSAESVWGHVAYVESVASNGSFVVSEMNFTAWGVVDFRTIVPGRVPVLGFVY